MDQFMPVHTEKTWLMKLLPEIKTSNKTIPTSLLRWWALANLVILGAIFYMLQTNLEEATAGNIGAASNARTISMVGVIMNIVFFLYAVYCKDGSSKVTSGTRNHGSLIFYGITVLWCMLIVLARFYPGSPTATMSIAASILFAAGLCAVVNSIFGIVLLLRLPAMHRTAAFIAVFVLNVLVGAGFVAYL